MKTKLILEFGCNHNGDINTAISMINIAASLGVWGIKFQKRDIESIPEETKNQPRDLSTSFGETYYLHRKALEFDIRQLSELKHYAESMGLEFACTAFDEKSIDELANIGCEYIKLPSQMYSDKNLKIALLQAKKENNLKAWVSTGMHDGVEIFSNSWVYDADVIFHCISIYPARINEINLSTLIKLSGLRAGVGYSSHENDGKGIKYAVLSGAEYIERHFTLDHSMKGSDHDTVSSTPTEIKNIISEIEDAEEMIGDESRKINFREEKTKKVYRG